jgi:hypothetical protein
MQSLSLKAQSEPLPWGSLLKLWVFDDQSTAYGENELRQWYPMAEQITINDHSLAEYVKHVNPFSRTCSVRVGLKIWDLLIKANGYSSFIAVALVTGVRVDTKQMPKACN